MNNNDVEIKTYSDSDLGDSMHANEMATEPKPINPLQQVHALLRGRYWIASLLAVMGLAIGSVIGYRIPKPLYESAGLLRIKPVLPVLYQNQQNNGVMPMFEAYVDSQVALIKSQRITDLAMQDPAWAALHRGLTPNDIEQFNNSLTVDHPKASELIELTFDDHDPEAARIAVGATIDAYQHLYGENDSESATQRLQVLEERRVALSNELKGLNDRILAISNEYGSNALDKLYQFKLDELNKLETQLHEADLAVATARSAKAPTTGPAAMMDEWLEIRSPEVRELISQKRELERKLSADSLRLGEGNSQYVTDKAALDMVNGQIEKLSEAYRQLGPDVFETSRSSSPGLIDGQKSLERLQTEQKNIRALYDTAKAETLDMGRKCVELDSLHNDSETLKTHLEETKEGIEQINLESSVGGRLTVESHGDRPLQPIKDKRVAFAAGIGIGTGALGIGLVLLFGLINRRVRHISDVREGFEAMNRILGVVPAISDSLDPESAAIAAHSVHHIRTLLQHRRRSEEKPVFVITSASPGAGKTSLVQALGLSFAASGSKTLLIDCDIVGGGLTGRMKRTMHRRLGQILKRKGLVTDQQITEALELATKSHRRIGQVLEQMGLVLERDVMDALETQEQTSVGLLDALKGEPIAECIAYTGTPGLFLMSLGCADTRHIGQLSYGALRRIVDEARKNFDTILIDTGPILGSLEASVAAMVADQVVLTLSRGEQRAMLQRALQSLTSCGANIAGLVLNRADSDDMFNSGFSSSTSRRSVNRSAPQRLLEDLPTEHGALQLGPIGSAVFALTDSVSNG